MDGWTQFVIPGAVLAVVIRLDGRVVGPYFAMSELVTGMGGIESRWWYRQSTLRWALTRRFVYPVVLGVVMEVMGRDLTAVYSAAVFGWGLLLWPAVFHGLPYGVSRRDWQVPALWATVFFAFAALAAVGAHLAEVIRELGGGSYAGYWRERGPEALVNLLLAIAGPAFFKGVHRSLIEKKERRESIGREYSFDGPHANLDQAPEDDPHVD